ncbi:MAG: TSUP family transporter [Cycloclasticus sp.]|jgi:Predicted permeases
MLATELTPLMILSLSVVAFVAGYISSIAGAGGLITLPILLWFGLPPINALATNKVQSALGTLSSSWNFFRKGYINLTEIRYAIVLAVLGSICGTLLAQRMGNELLLRLTPVLLIMIALYFLFSPRVSDKSSVARLSALSFGLFAAFPIGLYGGFFGPGMGSVLPFLFVFLNGYNLSKATAQTKVLILAINGVSALLFALHGDVIWELALYMSVAQIIGARLGSNRVMSRGTSLVQPLIVCITLLMALKLLFFP